jgi:hypothetical protein
MEIQRLIANDPEDCRGLINTLVTNGFVVWMAKVYDAKTRRSNTIVFYTLWENLLCNSVLDIVRRGSAKVTPGKPSTGDEEDDEPEPEAETDYYDPGSCSTYSEGVPCCLPRGHKGDHSYKCESPNCPGYSWPAVVRPHPPACYSEKHSKRVATVREIVYCGTIKEGRQCILREGHKGDCLFICDDPSCPGYSWPASLERPHPTNTCQP